MSVSLLCAGGLGSPDGWQNCSAVRRCSRKWVWSCWRCPGLPLQLQEARSLIYLPPLKLHGCLGRFYQVLDPSISKLEDIPLESRGGMVSTVA